MASKCVMCETDIVGRRSDSIYCLGCVSKRKNERQRARYAKNRKPTKNSARACVVCGKQFACPPSRQEKMKTCSPVCESKNRSSISKAQSPAVEPKRLAGLAASPRTGRFETHANAKGWKIESPKGVVYEFRNLRLWVDTHADLYNGTPDQAYVGLLRVKGTLSGAVKRNGTRHWRGWKVLGWEE